MTRIGSLIALCIVFLISLLRLPAAAQQTTPAAEPSPHATTVRGCLDRDRGNYTLVEDNTSMVYVLKGVGNTLDSLVHHEVEARGQMRPGTMKSGVRPEKAGSNPSDTVHGVYGVAFQIANPQADVRMIAKRCQPADQR